MLGRASGTGHQGQGQLDKGIQGRSQGEQERLAKCRLKPIFHKAFLGRKGQTALCWGHFRYFSCPNRLHF